MVYSTSWNLIEKIGGEDIDSDHFKVIFLPKFKRGDSEI